jgi:predicted alpha/beta-fold hydrolase
MVKLK